MLADTAIDIRDIRDSGSLSSLILKGNELANSEAGAALGSMLKTGMTEADFSGAEIGKSGAIILAGWVEHKVQHMA